MAIKTIIIVFFLFLYNLSFAIELGSDTGLKLPRYVSLKSSDSNIRVGPSKNYPILINYKTSNYPLKVIEEYQDWRHIIDFEDNTGWIHKSLIKGERSGIIRVFNKKKVYVFNSANGKKIGEINSELIVQLPRCKKNWCFIVKDNNKGWVDKKHIWGVEKDEVYNLGLINMIIDYFYRSFNYIEKHVS